jgi:murein DD-endopeptidase MepM/ murein hydrolase activator NlpD
MVRALLLAALSTFVPPVPGNPIPGNLVPGAGVAFVPPAAVATPHVPVGTAAAWDWPLAPDPAVVGVFRAPPTPWSAGHRGVDLAAAVGQPVLSAGPGRVTFSGMVAGRGVVVVLHPGALRTSYEPIDDRVLTGTMVQTGSSLGVVAAVPGHCAPATCLHWGLRRDETYLDPLVLLGLGPPVLLLLSPR